MTKIVQLLVSERQKEWMTKMANDKTTCEWQKEQIMTKGAYTKKGKWQKGTNDKRSKWLKGRITKESDNNRSIACKTKKEWVTKMANDKSADDKTACEQIMTKGVNDKRSIRQKEPMTKRGEWQKEVIKIVQFAC